MFQRDIREDLDAFADSHNAALGKFNKVTKAAKVEKREANRPSIANYNGEPSRSILKKEGSPKRSKKQLTHSSTITMPYASRESVASPVEGRGTVGALEDLGVDTSGLLTRKSTHMALEDDQAYAQAQKLPVWDVDITLSFLITFSHDEEEKQPPFINDTFSGSHRSLVPFVMPMLVRGSRVRCVLRVKTTPFGHGPGDSADRVAASHGPELKNDFLVKALRLESVSAILDLKI